LISRRQLARALAMKPGSLAMADRRGKGPGRPIHVSDTHVVYDETEVSAWLAARGLEWRDGTVRRINEPAAAAGPTS
jgi:hypothetical protein